MIAEKPVRSLLGLATLVVLSALVAGCPATTPTTPQASDGARALEERARQAEAAGDARTAMQLYRGLADQSRGEQRARYLIDAARLAIELDDRELAMQWLREAGGDAGAPEQQAITVLLADIDVREGRAANALARLGQLREPLPTRVMTDAQSVRGRALFALDRIVEAVEVLVERETWLETSDEILENQRLIWEGLSSPRAASVRPTGDPLVDGWIALAPIAASGVSGNELRGALIEWRREHVGHPAASGLLADLLSTGRGGAAYPRQVALLLPMSTARAPASAIRDGFLAAHLADRSAEGNADVSIRIYDTSTLGAAEAYQRAQLEGADFIVGPLLAQEVEQILPQVGLVPTLALNFVDTETTWLTGFWQFALAPEDEIRAIARRAYAEGARTALALVPLDSSGRGNRLLNSFRSEFEALGGRLIRYETYDPAAQDFSRPIRALLNLDRSEQRRARLAANLGIELGFEPRRRQDADMIFLYAPNRGVARLLAPALRYHYAADIPTYATPEIYDPADAGRDGDLEDIAFPDAPWLIAPTPEQAQLRTLLQSYSPQRASGGNLRLYGMGVDAYRLVGALYGGAEHWPIEGLTGTLELRPDGKIHRMLPFARFRNGRPVALEPVDVERRPAVAGELRRPAILGAR